MSRRPARRSANRELLDAALRNTLYERPEPPDVVAGIHRVERRLINLLSTHRLYIDQVKHDVRTIYGKESKNFRALISYFTAAYDARLGYRVMEALRNHVQHRSLPIQAHSFEGSWIQTDSGERRRSTVTVGLRVDQLRADPEFKVSVINELAAKAKETKGEIISLTPLVRESVAGLGEVHTQLRDLIAEDVRTWDNSIQGLMQRFQDQSNESVIGLCAMAYDEGGIKTEEFAILDALIMRRRWLEAKNRNTAHLAPMLIVAE